METQEFLRRVLPSEGLGLYCAVELPSTKHWFCDTIDGLLPHFDAMVERQRDAYYGLAAYDWEAPNTDKPRTQENARYMRAFFIDMDGYASPKAAFEALMSFLDRHGLLAMGTPLCVSSGGGLHAYWPLDRDIRIEEWQPVAQNIKRLCKQEKLRIDQKVTADSARVLRPPGTYNFKPDYQPRTPKVRVVLASADTFNPVAFGNAIAALLVEEEEPESNVIPLAIAGQRPQNIVSSNVTMFKNTTSLFKHLWERTEQGRGCQQLQYYIDHATEKVEPLWRDLLSVARHCDDGLEYAQRLSALHPYSDAEFRSKWTALAEQPPHFCKTFEESNPGGCHGCPHRKNPRFTTPMILTREVMTTTTLPDEEMEIETVSDVEDARILRERPGTPNGFGYGENGGMFAYVEISEGTGKKKTSRTVKHPFLAFYMYPIEVLRDNLGAQSIRFRAEHPKGDKVFLLTSRDIAKRDTALAALAEQSIWAIGRDDADHLHKYLWACSEMASNSRDSVLMATQLGWQEDGSFVFAGKKFVAGQKPIDVPSNDAMRNVNTATRPKGTVEGFKRVIDMMIARRMYPHLAVVLLGAGSVFMRYTGLHGLVVHCASKNSGTGKSVSLDVASAVWGDPLRYKLSKETSKTTTENRVGLLNSLPLTMDEITIKARGNDAWFPDFLLSFTEGKGKERMKASVTEERINTSTWSTIALVSSNTQCADLLLTRPHAAEGEIRRLLEIHMDQRQDFNPVETEILQSLADNHGVLGYKIAQMLVDQDPERLSSRVRDMVKRTADELKADGSERFWMAGIGCAMLMGSLLRSLGIPLPMKEIHEVYKQTVEKLRAKIGANVRTSEDVLNAYLEEFSGGFVVVDHASDISKVMTNLGAGVDRTRVNSITGRIEHHHNGETHVIVTAQRMTQHCANMSFSVEQFRDDLIKMGVGLEVKKRSIGAHTRVPTPSVFCYVMKMRKARFDELTGNDAVGAA